MPGCTHIIGAGIAGLCRGPRRHGGRPRGDPLRGRAPGRRTLPHPRARGRIPARQRHACAVHGKPRRPRPPADHRGPPPMDRAGARRPAADGCADRSPEPGRALALVVARPLPPPRGADPRHPGADRAARILVRRPAGLRRDGAVRHPRRPDRAPDRRRAEHPRLHGLLAAPGPRHALPPRARGEPPPRRPQRTRARTSSSPRYGRWRTGARPSSRASASNRSAPAATGSPRS